MSKTNWCASIAALACLATAIVSAPATAAVGKQGLWPAAETGDLVLVATKKARAGRPPGRMIDKQLSQSGFKQQIQQYMGQANYQQMIGGQGLPGR